MKPELLQMIEQVPMLPDTVQKIELAYSNPDGTIKDMADAIKGDPLITAFILKTANSPMYGLSRSVTDIEHAVSLLGKDTVRTFAIAASANSCFEFDLSPYGMSVDTYMKRAQIQNALVTRWVGKVDKDKLKYLSLASFLLELGKVIISKYLITYKQASLLSEAIKSADTIQQAEIEAVGAKSEDITASLFFKWHFDPELVHLVRFANEPMEAYDEETQAMAKFLKVAKESVDLSGSITENSLAKAKALLEEYELEHDVFESVINSLQEAA